MPGRLLDTHWCQVTAAMLYYGCSIEGSRGFGYIFYDRCVWDQARGITLQVEERRVVKGLELFGYIQEHSFWVLEDLMRREIFRELEKLDRNGSWLKNSLPMRTLTPNR